jgi:glycosyltransferase involved in cell wall biosynthesis
MNTSSRKRISVCIPAFNGEIFIGEQIISILGQLDKDAEVVISDDNSTDRTLEIIHSFHDTRIKVVRNTRSAGPVSNLENALNNAQGDVIFLADQDDIWAPEKVSTMTPMLDKYDLVISDAAVIDRSGTVLHPSFYRLNHSGRGLIRNWVNNSFLGCCMAFNRNLLEYVLPFPTGIAMHDIWIGLNTALVARYHFMPEKLVLYRRHGDNASPTAEKINWRIGYMVRYRLFMMYHVILRRLQRQFPT